MLSVNNERKANRENNYSGVNIGKGAITHFTVDNGKPVGSSKVLTKYLASILMLLACFLIAKPSYLFTKSVVAQLLLNHAWQKSKNLGDHYLPWQWSDSYPVAQLIDVKNNHSWVVLSGMTGRSMAFAPSWLEDTAKPNQYGNTVISAHNDSHFQLLENTEVGDRFIVEDEHGVKFNYRVITINIVDESDISPYEFQDETMITLITCYPFEVTNEAKRNRLVIQAIKV